MIEELYAIGMGVVKENGGVDEALIKYITAMNPYLPKTVGLFDSKKMKIVSVIDPRNNPEVARKYILYKSGSNDSPANYSPVFRPKAIRKDMDILLSWKGWPKDYRKIFKDIQERAEEIAQNAKEAGVEYVVISINGRAHTDDPHVRKYFLDKIRDKILENSVGGTCLICGKQGKVTGSALRLANLKFATPDKEVFMPIVPRKAKGKKAFSAQFPLCEEHAKVVMLGAAFAASETQGCLRDRIANVGDATYEYIVLPMPKAGKEKSVLEEAREHSPEDIAAMADVEELRQKINTNVGNPILQQFYQNLMVPIGYVSVYFIEKTRALAIIGSARYISPNTLSRLMNAREKAQISVAEWFGRYLQYVPIEWTRKKNLFYDMVALQLSDGQHSEKEVAVALKQAIQEYILALDGHWKRAETWLKNVITREAGRLLLNGKDVRGYLSRGVAAVLTVESMGGGEDMTVDKMIEVVKSHPDQYVAFLAGLLSAEAMRCQRRNKKDLDVGKEPFRKVVGNAAMGDLEDFKRILVLAVDKINQYGGSPRWALKDYPIDVPELLSVKKTSRTEDLRFAFVLGLLVGETRLIRESKEKGGEEDGEKT